jgi:hypothetical protein
LNAARQDLKQYMRRLEGQREAIDEQKKAEAEKKAREAGAIRT